MNLETGTPSAKGRYVAYVQCESSQVRGWCEAKLATWLGDRWDIGVPVLYFAGPLPAMKMPAPRQPPEPGSDEEFLSGHQWTDEQIAKATAARQEYDL